MYNNMANSMQEQSNASQCKYMTQKILIGNVRGGKVPTGNTQCAKYFVGNATGKQTTTNPTILFYAPSVNDEWLKYENITDSNAFVCFRILVSPDV